MLYSQNVRYSTDPNLVVNVAISGEMTDLNQGNPLTTSKLGKPITIRNLMSYKQDVYLQIARQILIIWSLLKVGRHPKIQ